MGWRQFLSVEASTNIEFVDLYKLSGDHLQGIQKIIVTYLIANSPGFLLDTDC